MNITVYVFSWPLIHDCSQVAWLFGIGWAIKTAWGGWWGERSITASFPLRLPHAEELGHLATWLPASFWSYPPSDCSVRLVYFSQHHIGQLAPRKIKNYKFKETQMVRNNLFRIRYWWNHLNFKSKELFKPSMIEQKFVVWSLWWIMLPNLI